MKSSGGRKILLRRRLSATWFVATVGLLCSWFLVTAQSYGGDTWKYPTGIAAIAVLLCLLEFARKVRNPESLDKGETTFNAPWLRTTAVSAWFLITVATIYVFGLIIGIFLTVTVYFYVFVRQSIWLACVFGAAHAGFIWVVFDIAAGLRLYDGI